MLLLMLFAFSPARARRSRLACCRSCRRCCPRARVGGRRRPLGIVIGLASTFTIAIVALAQLVKGVGLASGAARTLAIVVLFGFGLVLLIPELAARVQAPLSRLARFGPRTRGTGFWSGVGVGGALGFVCAPCAGPILAAVTSVSASGGASARIVAVAVSYSLGLSAVMLLYAFGGRAVIERIRRSARGHIVERTLGAVLLVTGVVMATNLDVRFEEALARTRASRRSSSIRPARSRTRTPSRTGSRRCVRRRRSSTGSGLRLRTRRQSPRASRFRGSRRRSCPSSAPRPSSPTPSAGSTRPGAAP